MEKKGLGKNLNENADLKLQIFSARLVDKTFEVIMQRDGATPGKQQSLTLYSATGDDRYNPASGQIVKEVKADMARNVAFAAEQLNEQERSEMSILVPELVKALVLNGEMIGQVYKPDLAVLVGIAVDMFMHPELVDQTHFRVGYGGETRVNSRSPAYIIPALTSIREIGRVFARQENRALQRELYKTSNKYGFPANEIDSLLINLIDRAVQSKGQEMEFQQAAGRYEQSVVTGQKQLTPAQFKLSQLTQTNYLTTQESKKILDSAWQSLQSRLLESGVEITKEDLNAIKVDLQKRYHFTNKIPKLVVFNASHAAININHMDQGQVLRARDQTQALLSRYVALASPEVVDSLVFQNDQPWDTWKDDDFTLTLIEFSRNVIEEAKGATAVRSTLGKFGNHHIQSAESSEMVLGMQPSDAYSVLHPFFFSDLLVNDSGDSRIPQPLIMEPITSARNVIFHAGPPEKVFGVYRKAVLEYTTYENFIHWMRNNKPADFAVKVEEKMKTLPAQSTERQAELIVKIGNTPVYYPIEGADAVLSVREVPSKARYDEMLEVLKRAAARHEDAQAIVHDLAMRYVQSADDQPFQEPDDPILISWFYEDVEKAVWCFAEQGTIPNGDNFPLETALSSLFESRHRSLVTRFGLDGRYMGSEYIPKLVEVAQRRIRERQAVVQGARREYELLLGQIGPNLAETEATYQYLCANL